MKKYLNVLDFSKHEVMIIGLTEEESKKSELYSTLYDFVNFEKLDIKYEFDLGNSEFMLTDDVKLRYK